MQCWTKYEACRYIATAIIIEVEHSLFYSLYMLLHKSYIVRRSIIRTKCMPALLDLNLPIKQRKYTVHRLTDMMMPPPG